MMIHGDDAIPKQMDIYQRKELKKLFIQKKDEHNSSSFFVIFDINNLKWDR